MIEALIDPWPPFTFCRPQATVDQDAELSPAKSEDRKGGEGKTDANLTNFLSTDAAGTMRQPTCITSSIEGHSLATGLFAASVILPRA